MLRPKLDPVTTCVCATQQSLPLRTHRTIRLHCRVGAAMLASVGIVQPCLCAQQPAPRPSNVQQASAAPLPPGFVSAPESTGGGDGGTEPARLPEAPQPQAIQPQAIQPQAIQPTVAQPAAVPPQSGSANVSGTVLDVSGAAVPDASVTLVLHGQSDERVVTSNATGDFLFPNLPPGVYKVTIVASGLDTFISNDIHLSSGERYRLPMIALPVAPTTADVTVTVTQAEVATAQLHLEEKQRVFGIIPNFYTSYIWKAAPLKSTQKFQLAYKSLTDPVIFATTAGVAGVEQLHNTFPGYGRGPGGYLTRYAAAYGDTLTSRLIGNALLPALFRQDPRYFYRGSGSVRERAWYAMTRSVVTRGDNGRDQPNYSRILGYFAAAAISNLYHAPEDRKAGLTIRNGFIITGANAATNVIREFLLKRLTPNVPGYAEGKPADSAN